MVLAIIILSLLVIYLFLRLFILKSSIKQLKNDFNEIKLNTHVERHLKIKSPDNDLEALAKEINEYISYYFRRQDELKDDIKEIRSEITNLSHDLRTPLTSILGYLELIDKNHLPDDEKKNFEVVKRRCYQLNGLIQQLYDYTRLESNEYKLQLKRVDLYRIVQEHILGFYMEFMNNNIDLQVVLPEDKKPLWIMADEQCIERVLTNLTTNALKYAGTEARIILKNESEKISLVYKTPRNGLSDYDIAHIFDRFYKRDSARTSAQSSGLGLTITRLFVERMDGRIYARWDDEYLYIYCDFKLMNQK